MTMWDSSNEAAGLTNELFYRNGPTPTAIFLTDAMLVKETIERGLREAFEAGKKSNAEIAGK